jgi:hypothetical protein
MASTHRTRGQTLATVLLGWNGMAGIVYAGLVPLPPFSDVPVPVVMQVLGLATVAAAVGVFRGQAWGFTLGVGVTLAGLVLEVFRVVDDSPRLGSSLEVLAFATIDVALAGILLWLLLRSRPRRRRALEE